ncbi:MAG: hypothetical protein ACM3O3_05220 [Syntrophothermus sp.]
MASNQYEDLTKINPYQPYNVTTGGGGGAISQALGNAQNFMNNFAKPAINAQSLPGVTGGNTPGAGVISQAIMNAQNVMKNVTNKATSNYQDYSKLNQPASTPTQMTPTAGAVNTGVIQAPKTAYTDQMLAALGELSQLLKTPLTYDSSKDEGFKAAQSVIGKNVYNDMARRGIADSTITPQQAYELSMQALPQFQANWQNQQQQNINNQLNMLAQLGNLDYNEFNKLVSEAGFTGKWNGQATLDAQKFAQTQQQDYANNTGLSFANQAQWNAYQGDTSKQQGEIISKYANQPGGIQSYINQLDPNSADYIIAQKARNQLIAQNPDKAKYGLSQIGQSTLTKQQVDETKRQNDIQKAQSFREATGWDLSPENLSILESAKNNPNLTKYEKNYQARIDELYKKNPNDPNIKPLVLLRDNKIITGGLDQQISNYGTKTLDYKKTQSDLKLATKDMTTKDLQNIGLSIANKIASVDLKFADKTKQAEYNKILTDIESGKLSNAQQRIINSTLPDKLKAELNQLIAGTTSTYHDMEYKDASLAADIAYKDSSLALEGERVDISRDSANASSYKIDNSDVEKRSKSYTSYIDKNIVGKTGKITKAKAKSIGKYLAKISNSGDDYDYAAAASLFKKYNLEPGDYGVKVKK